MSVTGWVTSETSCSVWAASRSLIRSVLLRRGLTPRYRVSGMGMGEEMVDTLLVQGDRKPYSGRMGEHFRNQNSNIFG